MDKKDITIFIVAILFLCIVAPFLGADNNKDKTTTTENITIQATNIAKTSSQQYKWETGYIKTNIALKKKPKKSSKNIKTIDFNQKIECVKYNKKWAIVKYKGEEGYIKLNQISKKSMECTTYNTPDSKLMSYMSYTAITNTSSNQYKLQQIAYTGKYGIRQVNGRYCIAVGSAYSTTIGTYIDLILKNGTVIPCILGDCKSDAHTDSRNILTGDGSLAEFVVDTNSLVYNARYTGDVHNACKKWQSDIVKIKIYKKVEKY